MRPTAAVSVLLAGLLTGGMIASGATPALARPQPDEKVATTLSTRLAPPVVTVGEPAAVVIRVSPAAARPLTVQQRVDDAWTTLGTTTTTSAGRALVPLDTSVAGNQELRVVARAHGKLGPKISTLTLRVYTDASCRPAVPLVDGAARPEATCLVQRLDRWKSAGIMGVGQQLNVSNIDYLAPLDSLGDRRVSVVGFDLKELAEGETYQFPTPPLDKLVELAHNGAVLSASWHPDNPQSGGRYDDRSWHDLGDLLDASTPAYATFWADYDAKLALLKRFQDAGVAVVFRPLHEANGGWFWWGHPDPATYRKIWAKLQSRAAAADVHNIVWAYSFNAVTGKNVTDPVKLLPTHVDVAGIDAYDPEVGTGLAKDALPMSGYAAVAAKVKRMAITEAGPYNSTTGAWNPATITKAANAQKSHPIWSMLWYDDYPDNNPRYVRQISSLTGWRTWLDTCAYGFCPLS